MKRFVNVYRRFVCAMIIVAVWATLPMAIMRVERVEIVGDQVMVAREFPLSDRLGLPRPMVRHYEQVRRLNVQGDDAIACARSDYYRFTNPDPVVTWTLDSWAARCRMVPYRWDVMWKIWLFGIIPLRPITRDLLILNPPTGAAD